MSEAATVHSFQSAGKMPVAEYRRQRAELRATYGDTRKESAGLADQALAGFFRRSGWTQEELAREEHRSQPSISQHLCFGRFLHFIDPSIIPKNLTFKQFLNYWKRTNVPDERDHFRAVARLIEEETTVSKSHRGKKPIAEAIKTTCGNSGWHRFTTIQTKVQALIKDATLEDIRAVLTGMKQHGWHKVYCEKKKGVEIYRVVLAGNTQINLAALKQELDPIISGLKAEGRKNMATMSPSAVAHLAAQLEQTLDRLAQAPPPKEEDEEEE